MWLCLRNDLSEHTDEVQSELGIEPPTFRFVDDHSATQLLIYVVKYIKSLIYRTEEVMLDWAETRLLRFKDDAVQ